MSKTEITKILESVEEIPPIPSVVLKVLSITKNPKASIKDMVKVVKLDDTLTLKVLKLANSVYFNRSQKKIRSIEDALVKLGNNTLINMVIAESCSESLQKTALGYDLKRGELWRHSVACALASQRLANKTKFANRDVLFTSCMVHDIGKTILDAFTKKKKQEIINRLKDGGVTFTQTEMELLGCSHSEIGARILEKWNFPGEIISAVRYHHEPVQANHDRQLVYHVYLSDIMCLMMGIGLGLGGLSYQSQKEVFDMFNLSETDVGKLFINLVEDTAKAEEWIRI